MNEAYNYNTSTWDRDTAPERKTKTRRFKEESRLRENIRQAPQHLLGQHWNMLEETNQQHMHTSSNDIRHRNVVTHHPCKEQTAAAQTKMERSMLKITYRDRKTNIWVREKTKVTVVIGQVRRRKMNEITNGHCISPAGTT